MMAPNLVSLPNLLKQTQLLCTIIILAIKAELWVFILFIPLTGDAYMLYNSHTLTLLALETKTDIFANSVDRDGTAHTKIRIYTVCRSVFFLFVFFVFVFVFYSHPSLQKWTCTNPNSERCTSETQGWKRQNSIFHKNQFYSWLAYNYFSIKDS